MAVKSRGPQTVVAAAAASAAVVGITGFASACLAGGAPGGAALGALAGSAVVGGAVGAAIARAATRAVTLRIAKAAELAARTAREAAGYTVVGENFSIGLNRQSVNVDEAALLLAELARIVGESATGAEASLEISRRSRGVAERGREAVAAMIEAIRRIGGRNEALAREIEAGNHEIAKVVSVIDEIAGRTTVINDIAFQTKLLAFNASVEAARAGPAGAGFSVVADEVEKLARRSGEAAAEIGSMLERNARSVRDLIAANRDRISKSVAEGEGAVGEGVERASACGAVLDEIVANVTDVERRIAEITAACREQATRAEGIRDSIAQLRLIAAQSANGALSALDDIERLGVLATGASDLLESLGGGAVASAGRASSRAAAGAEIVIGMTNAHTGGAASLGIALCLGVRAAVERINAEGGIGGRRLRLVSYDDAYEPERARANVERLLGRDGAFALLGLVGTATTAAALELIERHDVPCIAPCTGAQRLRVPRNRNLFHLRAGYFEEAETLIRHLVDERGIREVALFIQDDAYGAAGERGVLRALRRRNLEPRGRGVYRRGTVDVGLAVRTLKDAAPSAVVLVGTSAACARFAIDSLAAGFAPVFANLSFVGASALLREAGAAAEGMLVSQVVPSPRDTRLPAAADYLRDLRALDPSAEPDHTGLEGYLGARLLATALGAIHGAPTRDALRASLGTLRADLGGFAVEFTPEEHRGSSRVWLTEVSGGRLREVT